MNTVKNKRFTVPATDIESQQRRPRLRVHPTLLAPLLSLFLFGQFSQAETSAQQPSDSESSSTYVTAPQPEVSDSVSDANDPRFVRDQYVREVELLQAQYGAYNSELAEALQGLGEAQQRLGKHTDAIETLKQSAHITRINEGLFAPAIMPMLNAMVESYAHLGDWEAVDDQHHFMMEINGANYGWNDERMLPILDKLTRWHMFAFFEAVSPEPSHHLHMARSLFSAASRVIELNFGQYDLRLAKQLRGRRIADYYLASIMADEAESQLRLERMQSIGRDENFRFAQGTRTISQGYLSGLRSSRHVVDIYENNDSARPEEVAEAMAELGDWYLRFNKRQSAIRTYLDAYSLLSENAETIAIRDRMFGRPKVLDFATDYSDYLTPAGKKLSTGYVLLELDLTKAGLVSRAQFIEEKPAQPSMRRRALRELRSRRFRPRFEDGAPVPTAALKYRYRYEYAGPPISASSSEPKQATQVDKAEGTKLENKAASSKPLKDHSPEGDSDATL
ncbi:MAG: energy transducer TonB [Pseudomonadales bacterium]